MEEGGGKVGEEGNLTVIGPLVGNMIDEKQLIAAAEELAKVQTEPVAVENAQTHSVDLTEHLITYEEVASTLETSINVGAPNRSQVRSQFDLPTF